MIRIDCLRYQEYKSQGIIARIVKRIRQRGPMVIQLTHRIRVLSKRFTSVHCHREREREREMGRGGEGAVEMEEENMAAWLVGVNTLKIQPFILPPLGIIWSLSLSFILWVLDYVFVWLWSGSFDWVANDDVVLVASVSLSSSSSSSISNILFFWLSKVSF